MCHVGSQTASIVARYRARADGALRSMAAPLLLLLLLLVVLSVRMRVRVAVEDGTTIGHGRRRGWCVMADLDLRIVGLRLTMILRRHHLRSESFVSSRWGTIEFLVILVAAVEVGRALMLTGTRVLRHC